MSNNEDMEIDIDRGDGIHGTNENREGHEAKVNKSGSCGVNEKDRAATVIANPKPRPPQQTEKEQQ
jgi:hypothetical protein